MATRFAFLNAVAVLPVAAMMAPPNNEPEPFPKP